MNQDFLHILMEFMKKAIDVLGARSHLWELGNFEGTGAVIECFANDDRLSRVNFKTIGLEFFYNWFWRNYAL